MLRDYWLTVSLIGQLVLLYKTLVNGLFFGALGGGGGGCGCGCCGPPPCCGTISMPSASLGCGNNAFMSGGCMNSLPCSTAGCMGMTPCLNNEFSLNGGGCSQSGPSPMANSKLLPFSYAVAPSPLPTFMLQLPQTSEASRSTGLTENSSGSRSLNSYIPYIAPSNTVSSYVSNSPAPAPPSDYKENVDLSDDVEKLKSGNEIAGVDPIENKIIRSTTSPNDLYNDKMPDVEDYGDVTNKSDKVDKKSDLLTDDFSDDSFKTKVSGLPNDLTSAGDQDTTGDPKCSSETLRIIMQENIVSSPTISKQLIFSAGRLAFGQTIDVICSRNKFSYTVVSSKIFCEASRGRITCFAFLQP